MRSPVLIGFLVVGITIIIQTLGSAGLLSFLQRWRHNRQRPVTLSLTLATLATIGTGLLAMHALQVGVWAVTYLLLPDIPEINSLEQAAYFSIVTFTTLGFGDVTISGGWRLLGGIEAMNGILLFGWSTALLFALVQRIAGSTLAHSDDGSSS